MYTEADIRRFYSYVYVAKPDECWEWFGCTTNTGYGIFSIQGKSMNAQRFAFWIATGMHPGKLYVCHSCDNPLCVNPKHLWLGTASANQLDSYKKGRIRPSIALRNQ